MYAFYTKLLLLIDQRSYSEELIKTADLESLLVYPLLELSANNFEYVPEITYLVNSKLEPKYYSFENKMKRKEAVKLIRKMKRLKTVSNLFPSLGKKWVYLFLIRIINQFINLFIFSIVLILRFAILLFVYLMKHFIHKYIG